MGQCGGWEEQVAVFVVVGCCLALGCLGKSMDKAEQSKRHLLGSRSVMAPL